MTLTALTRAVSPSIVECALTYLDRLAIDPDLAARQHESYVEAIRRLGATVVELPAQPDLPDAVFVEDTAVVVDEIAVTTRPRLPSRRAEIESTAEVLAQYRPQRALTGDASLEGGDVVRIGRTLYVGLSSRTNEAGIAQLTEFLQPFGYDVRAVPVNSCLHLKTACTYIGRSTLLANPEWVDTDQFADVHVIAVSCDEPEAGNALPIGEGLIMPASFPATRHRLEERGFSIEAVDVSELQKAEAGVTCCSIVFDNPGVQAP